MKRVAIVGAGVSGLTCAVRLLESGFDVSVVTSEKPDETTSSVAAALWFPFRAYPLEKVVEWSLASLERFSMLETDRRAGIRTTTVREVYREAPPSAAWREGLRGFRVLGTDELPPRFAGGFAMRVPVIDSSLYLPFLVETIERRGGRIIVREVGDLARDLAEARLVVNCSGTGARKLVSDESVYPIRGQIVRLSRGEFDDVIVDEGSAEASYIVPRAQDCILGTTVEEDVWDRTPSERSSREILARCRELDPRVETLSFLDARVGLRPGRHEVRLELERPEDGPPVVHNYGHGGSGFTLSWGCAGEVTRLVESALQ